MHQLSANEYNDPIYFDKQDSNKNIFFIHSYSQLTGGSRLIVKKMHILQSVINCLIQFTEKRWWAKRKNPFGFNQNGFLKNYREDPNLNQLISDDN